MQADTGGNRPARSIGLDLELRQLVAAHDERVNREPKPGHFTGYYLEDHLDNVHDVCMTVAETLGWDEGHPLYLPLSYAAKGHDVGKVDEEFSDYRLDGRLPAAKKAGLDPHGERSREALEQAAESLPEIYRLDHYDKLIIAAGVVPFHERFWLLKGQSILLLGIILCFSDKLVGTMEFRGHNSHPGAPQGEAVDILLANALARVPPEEGGRVLEPAMRVLNIIVWLFGPQSDGTFRHMVNLRRNAPRPAQHR